MAGLLEGEGCFGFYGNRQPVIIVQMTDPDVIQKFANYFNSSVNLANRKARREYGHKQTYRTVLNGSKAAGLMMTLYQFMGERRKAKIREVLSKWKEVPYSRNPMYRVPWKNS